jgi:DNA-binding NarL/FixJ family response regulator
MVGVLLETIVSGFGFKVGRARSVAEAKKLMESLDPDIAIVDIDLGQGPNGLDFARIIAKSHPHIAVLFLSRLSETDSGLRGMKGIPERVSYLSKLDLYDTDHVQQAMELCLRKPQSNQSVSQIRLRNSGLTEAQYDLVANIAAGSTPKDIAVAKNKSVRTIELMMSRIQDQKPELVLDSKRTRAESASKFLEGLL